MKRIINWGVLWSFLLIGILLGHFWGGVVWAAYSYLAGYYVARTILIIFVVVVVWELFEYWWERFLKRVCDRPHHEGEYPWS